MGACGRKVQGSRVHGKCTLPYVKGCMATANGSTVGSVGNGHQFMASANNKKKVRSGGNGRQLQFLRAFACTGFCTRNVHFLLYDCGSIHSLLETAGIDSIYLPANHVSKLPSQMPLPHLLHVSLSPSAASSKFC